MTLRFAILMAALAAGSALAVTLSAGRVARAESRLDGAATSLARTVEDAGRILDLRAMRQKIAERKRPDQDVIARVSAALAASGIPTDRFGGLRPEADAASPGAVPGGGAIYRRQSVRVTLNDLTVRQIGAFLVQWSASQPLWTPTRIELTHARTGQAAEHYTMNLLLSATYVADGESP
jgi:hypothetical protein